MFWKKTKVEERPVFRVPWFLCTSNGLIIPTFGEQPVKTMTLSQAFNEIERLESQAHNDYQSGFTVGAENTMDRANDLRKAIRILIDAMEKLDASTTVFYF